MTPTLYGKNCKFFKTPLSGNSQKKNKPASGSCWNFNILNVFLVGHNINLSNPGFERRTSPSILSEETPLSVTGNE